MAGDFSQRADEYLSQELKAETFTGSVMVAASNSVLFIKGYGLANREHEIPNAPHTKFRIGSIGKQFTAICVLRLQELGKLSLDDPVSRFVENCPASWNQIKVHHLLTHTSGIPSYTRLPHYSLYMARLNWPPEKLIERFRDKPLEFAPGVGFNYSNSGYFLLGHIVEKSSGTRYEDYLQEILFRPLGMVNSGYDHFERILPHRATGYSWDGNQWKNSPYIDMSVPYAAGALYSTAEDFFLWYQCWRERKILSQASWKTMTAPKPNGREYGRFGINVTEQFGHRVFDHGGGINGFRSYMSWFPDVDLFICAFGNANSARSEVVARNLAALMFNKPIVLPRRRNVVKLAQKELEPLVGRYGLRANFILTVTVSGDRLFVRATGQRMHEIFAESDTKFFTKDFDADITFCKDAAGKITHLVLHQNGDHEARRLA